MKTKFTNVCTLILAIFMCVGLTTVKAQTCTSPAMSWKNPVLISGTALQVNAVYKFPSVTPGVYALVTVTGIVNGAVLLNIDDNMNNGYPAAWQPVIQTPSAQVACDSYVKFKIEFKDSVGNTNHQYNCFQLSFIDIDGDFSHIREFVATKDFDSYVVSNNTQLTMSQLSGGFTQATGPLQGYPAIDTSAYSTNINFRFINKNSINEVRLGNRVDAQHDIDGRLSCGYFAQITMPIQILPVNYLSFDAIVNDKAVLLKWITANEINNSHFEIERSSDNINFNTIGLVYQGASINSTDYSYQFTDNLYNQKDVSIIYYRLKQIDKDGKATYSKVLVVRLKADSDFQVSPNPFKEYLNVRFTATENCNAQIRVNSMSGQTLKTKQFTIAKGFYNIQIAALDNLPPGMYIVQLIMNGEIIDNQKIIKQ